MLVLAIEYLLSNTYMGIDIKTKTFEFPFVIAHTLCVKSILKHTLNLDDERVALIYTPKTTINSFMAVYCRDKTLYTPAAETPNAI